MSFGKVGFIILRHVTNEITNNYWKYNISKIMEYYPDYNIVVIDDNSKKEYMKEMYDCKNKRLLLIESEYPGRGELLPYYYLLKYELFNTAIILHDSAFINKKIDFEFENYKMIWKFKTHIYDNIKKEISLIKKLENNEKILKIYNEKKWNGCFGGMSIIELNYLKDLNNKHNLNILLEHIQTREDRMCFERVISCLLQSGEEEILNKSLLGDIHQYCPWGINIKQIKHPKIRNLPIIKVWSGR